MDANLHQLRVIPQKLQSGLMLIEVLVSLLIFSIGILGMVGLQVMATQNSAGAENRTIASNLANDIVSQMWLRKTADPSNASLASDITGWKTRVSQSILPNATAAVTKTGDVTQIVITWKAPSKRSTDNVSQYVTQVAIPN